MLIHSKCLTPIQPRIAQRIEPEDLIYFDDPPMEYYCPFCLTVIEDLVNDLEVVDEYRTA
jgi:hypothetical protein